jgi:RhtB (resistance to homoserine/threonine) family protein
VSETVARRLCDDERSGDGRRSPLVAMMSAEQADSLQSYVLGARPEDCTFPAAYTSTVQLDLAPFFALSILLILIPGPDTAVVTKNALIGGRRLGVATAVGVSIGLLIWTTAAALGIAALLQASDVAFDALRIGGALYLVWIGVQMLRARDPLTRPAGPSAGRGHSFRALRQGLISDLGNPKIAIFFTSFLPQFVHGEGSAFGPLLILGLVFALLTLGWLAAYGVAVGHASAFIRRPRVRKTLDRITGVVLIAFGIRLALERG